MCPQPAHRSRPRESLENKAFPSRIGPRSFLRVDPRNHVMSPTSRELIANWIYAVAAQTALKARATAAKRRTRERQVTEMTAGPDAHVSARRSACLTTGVLAARGGGLTRRAPRG